MWPHEPSVVAGINALMAPGPTLIVIAQHPIGVGALPDACRQILACKRSARECGRWVGG